MAPPNGAPVSNSNSCPNCGYCPHCGRSNQPYRFIPAWPTPWYTPWYTNPYGYPNGTILMTTTSSTIGAGRTQ